MRHRIRHAASASTLVAAIVAGLLFLGTPLPVLAQGPTCVVDTGDLMAGGDSPGRIVPPGKYILWTQVKGQAWKSGTPVDLTGGHRYLVDISQGAGAGLQQDPAALNRFSKLGPGEVVVHYHNSSLTDRISATICAVGGPVAGVSEPGCVIDTGELIAGGDSPGRIVQPGKYVLWTQVKGQAWKSGTPVDLAGGHRYLVDINQGAGAGLQQDPAALNRFSKLNTDEVVVHYHNGSLTDRISATICPAPGLGMTQPTCSVATTDLAPGIETPGLLMAPGSYRLYTRVKGQAWAVGAPRSLSGGHRYLVDISQGAAAAGFAEDPSELGKYSKLNPGEVVVHYINRSLTDRISGTVCLDGIANPNVTIPSGGNTSVLLLIDTSGSMQGAKIANAIGAAVKAIAPLGPSTEIAVIAFSGCSDSDIRVVSPFLPMTPGNKSAVTAQIQGLTAGGSTALAKALGVGANFLRTNGRMARRSLVVLSDGEDTCGGNAAAVMHDINK